MPLPLLYLFVFVARKQERPGYPALLFFLGTVIHPGVHCHPAAGLRPLF
jgi:hypothetical protein